LEYHLKRGLALRGAIYELKNITFPPKTKRHTKYCVLLEDYSDKKEDIIVAFTTSDTGYGHLLSAVEIPKGSYDCFLLDTVIYLRNYKIVVVEKLFGKESTYKEQLRKADIEKINKAIENVPCDKATYIRMMG